MNPAAASTHRRRRQPSLARRRCRPRLPPPSQQHGGGGGSSSLLLALLLLLSALLLLSMTAADDVGGGAIVQEPSALPPPPVPAPIPPRRGRSSSRRRHSSPRVAREGQYDGEEALLIVGTVDGNVHAVGSEGEVVWSFDSGAPLVSSYYAGWDQQDGSSSTNQNNLPVVIPAVDGSLLLHTPGKGVQRLPLTAAQLVERAPFLAGDGTLYTGARTSEALMVDLASGKVLQRFSGPSADTVAHMVDPRLHAQPPGGGGGSKGGGGGSSGGDDGSGGGSHMPAPTPTATAGGGGGGGGRRQLLWLGRVEYSLRALDSATGQELWNLTVSELNPLFPGVPSGSGGGAGVGSVAAGGGVGGHLPAGEAGGKGVKGGGGKGGVGDSKGGGGVLAPGGAVGATSKALLDVLGPGPGWGGAGALLATPDGGLHRRDPTTGRVRLLAPLGAAPVSAFVVAPGGGGGGAGSLLAGGGGGNGVSVPLVHTLTREGEEDDSDASSTASSSEEDEQDEGDGGDGWADDDAWEGKEEETDEGEPKPTASPSKPLWLPHASAGVGGLSSATVSIGQLGNGRLFGIVLDPLAAAHDPARPPGGSVLPHYLQHRHPASSGIIDGLPSPSPGPSASDPPTTGGKPGGGRPPKPGGGAGTPGGPGGAGTGSLPRIHSHAQRDCPAGYPTSLCSLRRTGSGPVSGGGGAGRPTTAAKPLSPPVPTVGGDEEEEEEDDDDDEDSALLVAAASCRLGDPGFPGCLLGVHHLKALEAPPLASSPSASSWSSAVGGGGGGASCLPPGSPGSGLLDMCMPPLLEPPPSSSSDSSGFDWTRPATWSGRAKRDALLLLTLVLGAVLMTVLNGGMGKSALDGLLRPQPQKQGQQLVPSPSRGAAAVPDAEGNSRVGRLTVSPLVLGFGCHGTVVYRGMLDGRPVAVKRMLRVFHAAADREMRLLIESDGHPNVVRYFLREQAGDFVYLALELCVCSLRDVVARLEAWVRRRQLELQAAATAGDDDDSHDAAAGGGKAKKKKKRPPKEPTFIGGLLPPPASWATAGPNGDGSGGSGNNSSNSSGAAPPQVRAALQQIASGVAHLHSLRIVHRDIKPHNILLSSATAAASSDAGDGGLVLDGVEQLAGYVCKISDMGVGKLLAMGQSSFGASSFSAGINHASRAQAQQAQQALALRQQLQGNNGGSSSNGGGGVESSSSAGSASDGSSSSVPHGPGSVGWQAPEVMMGRLALLGATDADADADSSAGNGSAAAAAASSSSSSSSRRTQAVDIFSLGCVFYTVLVPGAHPFGQWYERERNILTGGPELGPLEASPDAHDLVEAMLQKDPARRPTARMVLGHPFFWDDERRLAFLVDFSDRLELEPADSLLVLAVEAGGAEVVGRAGWDRRLHRALLEDGSRYRKYDTASVRDCLRLLRNKRHHFHELPKDVQRLMAPLPGGLYRYFQACFPRLLMHCHGVCVRLLTRDKIFRTYIGGKEVEDDYEEDNASLGIGGGGAGGGYGVQSPPPLSSQAGMEEDAAAEGKGEEMGATGAAAVGVAAEASSTFTASSAPAPAALPKGDEELLSRVTVFAGGTLAGSYGCRGWWRPADHWARRLDAGKAKARPPHLTRQLTDGRYRTRLCQHWEASAATEPVCPMRQRRKCDFAHSPVELRVKEGRRGRWGTAREPPGPPSLRSSGGEDAIAQSRVAERSRAATVAGMGAGAEAGRGGGGGRGGGRRPTMGSPGPPPPPQPGVGSAGMDAASWRRGSPQPGYGGGYGDGYGGGYGYPPPQAPP